MFPLSPQATGDGRRNHLLLPNLIVGLFISLFFILKAMPSFISFTSQAFTPLLVEGLKTMHGLRLVLLLFVTVCVLLTINNSDNTGSYNRNDEHACNNSGNDLVCPHSQQRESKLQPKLVCTWSHQDVMRPGTPSPSPQADARRLRRRRKPVEPSSTAAQKPPLLDKKVRSNKVDDQDVMRPGTPSPSPQADARRRRRRKPVSPVKPSYTAAQKPPLLDKKVRSNKVDDQDVMRTGTPSPSPQADARRRRKPVSPVKPSFTAAQKPPLPDKKVRSNKVDDQDVMRPGSCSSEIMSSSSCSTPLQSPPPPWWFASPPHEHTTYVLVNSPSCDSADSTDVRAEDFIREFRGSFFENQVQE